jgi:hypothetical protein
MIIVVVMLTVLGCVQGVISLELLTVFVVGPLACLVCYDIAKRNPRANILMIIIATAEIYGGEYPFTCRLSLLVPQLRSITDCVLPSRRLDDLLPRVAHLQRQPGRQQLHVPVDLPRLLQHAVGVDPRIRHVCRHQGHLERFCDPDGEHEGEEGQVKG